MRRRPSRRRHDLFGDDSRLLDLAGGSARLVPIESDARADMTRLRQLCLVLIAVDVHRIIEVDYGSSVDLWSDLEWLVGLRTVTLLARPEDLD